MQVIPNKWIEKLRKKKDAETAASYKAEIFDSWDVANNETRIERYTKAAKSVYVKTLRGIRK